MPLLTRLILTSILALFAQSGFASGDMERPSDWDISALKRIDPAQMGYQTHSTMLVDGSGNILWSWGDTNKSLRLYSVRKSLLSALFGVLMENGRLDLSNTLGQLNIDDKQGLSDQETSATVRDLLMCRSGVYHPAAFETRRMFNDRPKRDQYEPGEHWFYNNWDFNALNSIFEQLSGQRVSDAFDEHFAQPLGMQQFSTEDVEYIYEDASIHPAVVFSMSASDLAKFGLLMLNDGHRDGKQLIPSRWVRESTRAHSDLGMFGGYGYSWWSAMHGDHFPFLRFPDGVFSARGTGEQTLLVLPSLNAVWVHLTRVDSPDQEMMHVSDTARLLERILDAHSNRDLFRDPRFRHQSRR